MNLNELQNLMDDLARNKGPSQSDLESREDELRAAFDAHPEWMDQMRTRDEFDVRLCKVMPQVDVPEGLKERLLTALDEPQIPVQTLPEADSQRRSRRRVLGTITITGATLLFGFAVWMVLHPLTPQLTVAEIENELPALWDAPEDAGSTVESDRAVLPSGWQSNWLRVSHDWKIHKVSSETLAVCRLEFMSGGGRIHTGLLASLPLSSFAPENQPTSPDPFFSRPRYLKTSSGIELAIISWSDPQRERVYFLAVPAADHSLKALEELLDVPPV